MACTATVDMTGLSVPVTAIENVINGTTGSVPDVATSLHAIATAITTLAAATALGDFVNALTGSGKPLAVLAGAIISGVLQTNTAGSGGSLDDLIAAIVSPGYTLPLADRISADKGPSLAQRISGTLAMDPAFTDIGSLCDRLAPLPTDAQCDAADTAWSTQPTTDNISDSINGIVISVEDY